MVANVPAVMAPGTDPHDTQHAYREMRDFARTPEPKPLPARRKAGGTAPVFVVQKHDASRLHWDFRLEHEGALWSWAVPKGPSLDPRHKRLAMHVEDHPVEYATFSGVIPKGNYGAGTVEIWDRGTWEPVQADAAAALARGELKFRLDGQRLRGGFVLVRLKPRPREKGESWLLIKEHDTHEREGADASMLERTPLGAAPNVSKPERARRRTRAVGNAPLPEAQAPQLAQLVHAPPSGAGWISEVKFDGYRMICRKHGDAVRIITRNGLDWTGRLPTLAAAVGAMAPEQAMLDGELVALDRKGLSSFARLQDAFSTGRTGSLRYYAFDLLHLDGTDLRPRPLSARREALEALMRAVPEDGPLRTSEQLRSDAAQVRRQACALGLEGIVCKRLDAPYRPGRSGDWVKVKCENREEFVVLGYTPPAGTRQGLGALQLGYHDEAGRLHFLGGCGTGYTARTLRGLADRLHALRDAAPDSLLGTEPPPRDTIWVRPELVAEIGFAGFTGGGMVRHATFLGLREDKPAAEVVRPALPSEVERVELGRRGRRPAPPAGQDVVVARRSGRSRAKADAVPDNKQGQGAALDPLGPQAPDPNPKGSGLKGSALHGVQGQSPWVSAGRIVVARRSERDAAEIAGQRVSHADRPLWPADAHGPALSKRDLALYWEAVASVASPGIVGRPLALVRCPDGIEGDHFFQKHLGRGMPDALHEAEADGAPFVAVDGPAGLVACAQVAAIELHSWGSSLADPLHADRLVFDLDPGEGVAMPAIVDAAREVKRRLETLGLAAFCRTSGGKGLHVVAPIRTQAGWDAVRAWSRWFAEAMEADSPDRYVSTTRKAERRNRILVDWLRNGLGSTAIASFSPRARPGAGVAMPLAWREVTPRLDPMAYTLRTVPGRLARRKTDPWAGFADAARALPAPPRHHAGKG